VVEAQEYDSDLAVWTKDQLDADLAGRAQVSHSEENFHER